MPQRDSCLPRLRHGLAPAWPPFLAISPGRDSIHRVDERASVTGVTILQGDGALAVEIKHARAGVNVGSDAKSELDVEVPSIALYFTPLDEARAKPAPIARPRSERVGRGAFRPPFRVTYACRSSTASS